MSEAVSAEINDALASFLGKKCWHVGCGGCVGSSFSLALGRRIRRSQPLPNPAADSEFRKYEPEAHILVWCTWRLDSPAHPLASSDQDPKIFAGALQALVGQEIQSVEVLPPAWDARIIFSRQMALRIFCDHMEPNPSIDENWQIGVNRRVIYFGPGGKRMIQEE